MIDECELRDEADFRATVAAYDELCKAYESATSNRALRRSSRVVAAREQLRLAIDALWQFDDGHSDFGYDSPLFCQNDELHCLAEIAELDLRLELLRGLRAVLLRQILAKTRLPRLRREWRQALECRASPPLRLGRSGPDLAHAPPAGRAVLYSIGTTASLAA